MQYDIDYWDGHDWQPMADAVSGDKAEALVELAIREARRSWAFDNTNRSDFRILESR